MARVALRDWGLTLSIGIEPRPHFLVEGELEFGLEAEEGRRVGLGFGV